MSGYGLRPGRAILWFVAVAALSTIAFHLRGLDLDPSTTGTAPASWAESAIFALRSMLGFFTPPAAELGSWGLGLQTALRFVGPVLLAQALLALRERVAR